jgi:hypothetical protein
MFNEERIDMQALLDSRKLTKEINKTLAPYTGEFGDAQKKHLLKRTMVGYASRHLKDLEGLTMDEAVDKIMTPHEMGEPVNTYYLDLSAEEYKEKYLNDDVGPGEPFISRPYKQINSPINNEILAEERFKSIFTWIHRSFYEQPTSICWKLFLFLHNLTPVNGGDGHKNTFAYIHLIYHGSFRNYRDFIKDLTLDPTMLQYLNLALSQKETPDENYAREIQELFTVGKRPFSKFTEEDVREAARLLVGWNNDRDRQFEEGWEPRPIFQDWNHDTGDKQFSDFYGNTKIQGREGQEGKEELEDFLDMIFRTDESAIYLSRRLFQYFVYPVTTDYVENEIIKPLAEVMKSNDFNLAETLKVLLKSEYFYSEELYNSVIKSPYDFTFGLIKELDLFNGSLMSWDFDNHIEYNSSNEEDRYFFDQRLFNHDYRGYYFFDWLTWHLGNQGMSILSPPSVSGWPAYYQDPIYDFFWINSVTITKRKRTSDPASTWGISVTNSTKLTVNLDEFISSFQEPENIDSFISELGDRFLGGPIPEPAYQRIRRSALGDSLSESYWTDAVLAFKSNPSKEMRSLMQSRLSQFMHLLFQLNEIHLH